LELEFFHQWQCQERTIKTKIYGKEEETLASFKACMNQEFVPFRLAILRPLDIGWGHGHYTFRLTNLLLNNIT
jgi:hypothetical protein